MIEEIKKLAEMQQQLAIQAYASYLPMVDDIIKSKQADIKQIERTLEGMLDFCYEPKMLMLFRKLCRHLYDFDPEAAAYYVKAYRELWDEDGKLFGINKEEKI